MESLKVQDCVQLLHGYTTKMTISEIDNEKQEAKCVWYDIKSRKYQTQWLPLNVLKPFMEPERISLNALKKATGF